MIVLAAAAHPDDIEFMMAGTLLRLKDAGCDIHLWNLANGCCGSQDLSRQETITCRWQEAQASAALAAGTCHPPLFEDLEIFYDKASVEKVAAVIREIQPDIDLKTFIELNGESLEIEVPIGVNFFFPDF